MRESQLHRLLKRAESLLELQLQVLETMFQVAHVSKDVSKQHLVMRLDLPGPRLLELGQFVAQGATRQISQLLWHRSPPPIRAASIRRPLLPNTELPTEAHLMLAVSSTLCKRLISCARSCTKVLR
jgi:hypothetical protein